jgi:inner membrane protein
LRSNNPRSEIAVFGFFIISGIFLQPLMADGFWTSYNRLFGTMTHLQSEFEKAEDVLQVNYHYREATTELTGSGLVIECTGTSADLWNPDTGWEYLDASPNSTRTILEIIPVHTGRKFELVRKSFVAISADSLDRLVNSDILYHIQLSANEAFSANYKTATSQEKTNSRSLDLELVEHLSIFELPDEVITSNIKFHHSPRIKSLELKIEQLRKKRQSQEVSAQNLRQRIATLEVIRDETTDLYEEQRANEQLKKLQKESQQVDSINESIREINVQIAELRAADRIKYEEKVTAAQLKYNASLSPTLELTGIATFVVIYDSPVTTTQDNR